MSGPSDLARLSDTIDKANELLLSDQIKIMDVGDGVMRPTNAKVLADLSVQMSGAMIYLTTAAGLAGTVVGGFFSVLSVTAAGYVDLYQNVAGVATFKKSYPSTEAVAAVDSIAQANAVAVANLNRLVQDFPSTAAEVDILLITDAEGGKLGGLTSKRFQTIPFDIVSEPGQTAVGDAEGGVVLYADDERIVLGELEFEHIAVPGIFITDREGGILDPSAVEPDLSSPFQGGLLFSPLIVTSDLHNSRIYAQGLCRRRGRATEAVLSVSSDTTSANETGASVGISARGYGPSATMNIRLAANPNIRKFMPLTLKNVPLQMLPNSPKILFIGDSIGDRQGSMYLKQFLEALGFTPQFIGTIETSASTTDVWDTTGPLGECHAGWKTGDFTYSKNDRAFVVSPGGETAYLALTKAARRERNPFLRLATGSDDASVVRNGYVFDPAFYQSRFGLQAPDIVINALGTNDALTITDGSLYAEVYENDLLMHKQIKAAWPNAKIIRTLPASAFSTDANLIWEAGRSVVISAMINASPVAANPKLSVAPLWAMTNPEVGYAYSQATLDADGFYTANWADAVHPIGSSRVELFQSLAPYIAAASLNII
jgi:hypothetical protein